jgi:hypothetical protein
MGWSILNALKGIGGEFEVQRVLGAFGTITYTICAPAFVAVGIIKDVSLTEFSLAYPAGLAACIGATAGAIALKDRGVATSRIIEAKGAVPAAPPAGPRVPAPLQPEDGKPEGIQNTGSG